MASTSPHDRIVERYRQEHPDSPISDEEDGDAQEFAQLSRRSTGDRFQSNQEGSSGNVHRSVSMNDLANDDAPALDGARGPAASLKTAHNPLHKAASVEGSLNAPTISTTAIPPPVIMSSKDNKENFAVPQSRPSQSTKREMKKSAVSTASTDAATANGGRKILNSQNAKSQ